MNADAIIVELTESIKKQVSVNLAVLDCLMEVIQGFPPNSSREPMVEKLKFLLEEIYSQRDAGLSVLEAAKKALNDEQ